MQISLFWLRNKLLRIAQKTLETFCRNTKCLFALNDKQDNAIKSCEKVKLLGTLLTIPPCCSFNYKMTKVRANFCQFGIATIFLIQMHCILFFQFWLHFICLPLFSIFFQHHLTLQRIQLCRFGNWLKQTSQTTALMSWNCKQNGKSLWICNQEVCNRSQFV